jgi:hypothetical protein
LQDDVDGQSSPRVKDEERRWRAISRKRGAAVEGENWHVWLARDSGNKYLSVTAALQY